MNTKLVQGQEVMRLWEFPPLLDGKQGRIFTKHFTNLPLIMHPNHFSLLSWLIYQSSYDNTVKYSTELLKGYQKTVKAGNRVYKSVNPYLNISPPNTRKYFIYLINNGFLLPTSPGVYLINPNLTYSRLYVKPQFYKEWVRSYYNTKSAFSDGKINLCDIKKNIEAIVKAYINHISGNYKRRKNS